MALTIVLAGCGGGGSSASGPVALPAPVATPTPAPARATPTPAPPVRTATPAPTAAPPTPNPAATLSHAPSAAPSGTPAAAPSQSPAPGPSTSPAAATAADAIVDMIGVNTHFSYVDTVYQYLTPGNPAPNGNSILSMLQTLGVRHVRDGDALMTTDPAICSAFAQAGAAGIDADIIVQATDNATIVGGIAPCVGAGLRAIEGPNELDLSGDKHFAADDVSAMTHLAAARGNLFPAGVSIVAPSLAAGCGSYQAEAAVNGDAIAGDIDFNNAHIYFGGFSPENTGTGGEQCGIGYYGTEYTSVNQARIPAPAKPVVVTETGYPDDCCSLSDNGYVSPAVKTTYTLRTLLAHYTSGIKYAYIYELATETTSYGLTDQLLNPKPAFTALENFIAILKDPGGAGAAGTLRLSLSPSLGTVDHVLLAKKDGSFWLILWQPVQSWNPAAGAPLSVAPLSGTIAFAAPPSALDLYAFNPADGSVTITPLVSGNVVPLSVTDTPEILQIGATAVNPVLTSGRRRR